MTPRRPGAVLGILAGATLAVTGCVTPAHAAAGTAPASSSLYAVTRPATADPASALAVSRLASAEASETGAFQNRLDSALQKMVDAVVGPGRAVVTTAVELDLDQVERVSTTYLRDPVPGALSEKLSRSAYAGGGASWESSSTDRVNALSSVRETRRNAPGSVKKLNIAVLVDATAATTINLAQLRTLVTVAAGVDAGRGDVVAVSAMPFHSEVTAAAGNPAEGTGAVLDRTRLSLAAGLGLLLLILLAAVARRRRARMPAGRVRLSAAPAALEPQRPITVSATVEAPRHDTAENRREIGRLAGEDPERAAAVLRAWAGSGH